MNRIGLIIAGALIALMLAASTLFIVDQRQVAVVYALGRVNVLSDLSQAPHLPSEALARLLGVK